MLLVVVRRVLVSLLETGSILRDVLPETIDAALWPVDRANDRRKIPFFFLFCLLLLPPSFFSFFFFSFFLASLDSLQALESVLASNSWLECLEERRSVYLLSVRYVVRLVNSVSILDRVPKNLPRGPSSPQ